MAPVKAGKYEYKPETLAQLRGKLGLSQAKMAKLLGVPANTLSRWETGATKPDADSLAAIYSVAMEHKCQISFFKRRRPVPKKPKGRSRLLAMWDFQNVTVPLIAVESVNAWIRQEFDRRFSSTSYRRFKAFASPSQSLAANELEKRGWRVWEDDEDIDDEIVSQARSDCGQEPQDTVLVLITQDGDFLDLIRDLRAKEVEVYLITAQHGYSQRLAQAVPKKQWVSIPSNVMTGMGNILSR